MSESALDAATAEVVAAFDAAGVPSVLLKGRAFAVSLYTDPAERPYGDADLLVEPSHLLEAERVLTRLGFFGRTYAAERGAPPARVWTRAIDGVAIELHTGLVGVEADGERTWQLLSAETERLEIAERSVPVLGTAARAFLVSIVAADKGAYADKSQRDLAAALERLSEDDWRAASVLAERLGGTAAFAAGLRLVPAGVTLAHRLRLPDAPPAAVAVRADASPNVRGAALSLVWIAGQAGWRARARAAGNVLFPSSREMRDAYPLARFGRFGLVLAYGSRLLMLAPRLLPAMSAYSAARRRSG